MYYRGSSARDVVLRSAHLEARMDSHIEMRGHVQLSQRPRLVALRLRAVAKKASAGDWSALTYTLLTADQMREFIRILNLSGNSVDCEQAAIEGTENILRKYGSFDAWAADSGNAQAIQWCFSAAIRYLFSLNLNVTPHANS
jgi:hypothetical protein